MRLSIIIPCLNEADTIVDALEALAPLREHGHEVIVVDAGDDDTAERAAPLADHVLQAPRGRAVQMNRGADVATGSVLLFLHADTRLPAKAERAIREGMAATGLEWGRFDVRLSGQQPLLRIVETLMNWRSRLTAIVTGDQALFVSRDLFRAVGGYPEIPLMEDIALSELLKRHGRPLCLHERVLTSSRRWEQGGILRTVLLMWWLRLRYFFGADPALLARVYDRQSHA